eukprot:7869136-Ditylum_brightwellii.AAC.1
MRLKEQIVYYGSRGLIIGAVHVDNELDCDEVRNMIGDAVLLVYAKEKHVQVVEKELRTIKECLRCTVYGLPYKKCSRLMLIGVVDHITKMIN